MTRNFRTGPPALLTCSSMKVSVPDGWARICAGPIVPQLRAQLFAALANDCACHYPVLVLQLGPADQGETAQLAEEKGLPVTESARTGRVSAPTVTPPTPWDARHIRGLIEIVREDVAVNGSLMTPGTQMLVHFRIGQWSLAPSRGVIGRVLAEIVYRLGYFYVRNLIGFEVPRTVALGRRVKFVHQHGVTVHPHAQIGDECLIRHLVTIGQRGEPGRSQRQSPPPRIGKGVQFGVGATIVAGVAVGDGAILGPHSLVSTDVPEEASVLAPPARILRLRGGLGD